MTTHELIVASHAKGYNLAKALFAYFKETPEAVATFKSAVEAFEASQELDRMLERGDSPAKVLDHMLDLMKRKLGERSNKESEPSDKASEQIAELTKLLDRVERLMK